VGIYTKLPIDASIIGVPPFNMMGAISIGSLAVQCNFDYSSDFECKVDLETPRWFSVTLEGAVWVARELAAETKQVVRIIACVATDLFGPGGWVDSAIQKTADEIVAGTLEVGADVSGWAVDSVAWCGWTAVTDGAQCGFDIVTDGAKCGTHTVTDGATCGFDLVTRGADCGYETVKDSAKCGASWVQNGAECGFSYIKSGAQCGWSYFSSIAECGASCAKCVSVIWGGSCDCQCSVENSCNVANSCNVPNTCSIPTSCNIPKSCEVENSCSVPKSCDIANPCQ